MTLQEQKVLDQENKIRYRESESHQCCTKHRDGTKTYYKSIGYQSEDAFLGDCMEWMRLKYPFLKDYVFHIPNEGYSSSQEAKIFASRNITKGVLKGVFDVLSVWKGMAWAEFKLPDGRFSDEQLRLADLWRAKDISITRIDKFEIWKNWIEKIIPCNR